MGFFNKFFEKPKVIRKVYVRMENQEQLALEDPNSFPELEKRVSEVAAWPEHLDMYDPICILSVENENLTDEEILKIFTDIGFKARIQKDPQ